MHPGGDWRAFNQRGRRKRLRESGQSGIQKIKGGSHDQPVAARCRVCYPKGMKILLVGGAVRNLVLGRSVADKDFLVLDTNRESFLRSFPQAKHVGKSFPVFLVNGYEFAFPRGTPADGSFDSILQADLEERDLTINAMALDESGNLYCHSRALDDIHNRILRPTSPHSFHDDPLRVFRAARFLSEYPDFHPHGELLHAMQDVADKGMLCKLAPLRIWNETRKALSSANPTQFFTLLEQTGCLTSWFKELVALRDIPAGPAPFHSETAFNHTMQVLAALAGNPLAGWMAVCHDLGKAQTPQDQWPRHHGHATRGGPLAAQLAHRLALPNLFREAGRFAAELHMKAARYPQLRPGTRVDLLSTLHSRGLVDALFAMIKADHGHNHLPLAQQDLSTILKIKLPPGQQNLGAESGLILRNLRAQAISQNPAH